MKSSVSLYEKVKVLKQDLPTDWESMVGYTIGYVIDCLFEPVKLRLNNVTGKHYINL